MPNERKDTCKTCRYWRETGRSDDETGECRINPPKLFDSLLPPESIFYEDILGASMFPATHDDTWCGQHEPSK